MADVLNPERTESTHLNTELQTPTLDAPADQFDPSEDQTTNPHATAPTVPHRAVDPRPVTAHSGSDDTELTGMEDFAAALESFDREQAAEAAAQAYDDNVVTGTVIKLTKPASASGTWTPAVLHNFSAATGANPAAGVIFDAKLLTLYGTTATGGKNGEGAVYKLAP